MTRLAAALAGIALLLSAAACYDDLKVVQGAVTAQDPAAHTLTVRDERAPNAAITVTLAAPAAVKAGDVVRIAYRDAGDAKRVVRIMNVGRARASAPPVK